MANNYLQFSEEIGGISQEEKEWIDSVPQGIEFSDNPDYEDDEEWITAFETALEEHSFSDAQIAELLGAGNIDEFPQFECKTKDGCWWLYAEEYADIEHVACVIQAFIRRFRPEFIFKLTWAETCDKPRIEQFGGGWLVVSKDEQIFGNTHQQVDDVVAALRRRANKK